VPRRSPAKHCTRFQPPSCITTCCATPARIRFQGAVEQVVSKSLLFRIADSSFIFYEAQIDPTFTTARQVFP
jgi:hypothetical protein